MEQKKLSHQNIKIKFKQIKHKILSKRKHKNYTPVEIQSTKKITTIQKNLSRATNLTTIILIK